MFKGKGRKKIIVFSFPRKKLASAGMFISISLLLLILAGPLSYLVSPGELYQVKIAIDPGHGGVDGGVSHNEVMEKDVNLKVALKLQKLLKEEGARVIMTRYQDDDVSDMFPSEKMSRYQRDVSGRIKLINDSRVDFFVSLHLNSVSASHVRGSICFYNATSEDSKRLAHSIQEHLNKVTGRNVKEGELLHQEAKPTTGIKILNTTHPPGALVEMGFMTNPRERELLQDGTYQADLARAIRDGMVSYQTESFD